MDIRIINSDSNSNQNNSFHDSWIERGIAVTSGGSSYRDALDRIVETDLVAIHSNELGLVAIGIPSHNKSVVVRDNLVSPIEAEEYHRSVEWVLDLRRVPISNKQLGKFRAKGTPHAVRRIEVGKSEALEYFETYFNENVPDSSLRSRLIGALEIIRFGTVATSIPLFRVGGLYTKSSSILQANSTLRVGQKIVLLPKAVCIFESEKLQVRSLHSSNFSPYEFALISIEGNPVADLHAIGVENSAVINSQVDGRAIHIFEPYDDKRFLYCGEYVYAGHDICPRIKAGKIVFSLILEAALKESEGSVKKHQSGAASKGLSFAEARTKAYAAVQPRSVLPPKQILKNVYARSEDVATYVLLRAAGICEACDQPSPFVRRDGSIYLEAHHTTRLSDGGPDAPSSVGAICPNCHREMHYGELGSAKNEALKRRIESKEQAITNQQDDQRNVPYSDS